MSWTRLVIALGVAAAIPAVPAQADPTFDFSLSAERVRPGDSITYQLTIKTGAEAERFGITVSPRPVGEVDGRPQWPLLKQGRVTYDGPGTYEHNFVSPGAPLGCSAFAFGTTRGAAHEGATRAWLELPAGTTSTLTVAGDTAFSGTPALTPRIGEVYGLNFVTQNDGWGERAGTLDAPGPLTAPVAQPADGPRGVHLSLSTQPQTAPPADFPCPPLPVVREPIVVRGRTHPPIPGHTVQIQGGHRASEKPQIIGSAEVGADGTFRFGPWTPPAAGDYELRAIYRSQSPDFVDDTMQGYQAFRYDPPAPPMVVEPASSALTLATRARVRRGAARLRVACPKTAGARCLGSLRLRRGHMTWGRRTIALAPGKAQTVRIRLTRRARAVLARRRSVRVQVDVRQRDAASRTLRLSLRR